MSLSLERMRALVRKGLGGLDSNDIDNDDVDELLNISLWEMESKFPFRSMQSNFLESLVIDQYIYSIATIERLDAIESVAVIDDETGKRTKLARMTRDWFDANFTEEEVGTPLRYMRENNCIYVYPIPDEVLDIEIHARQGVESLAEGTAESTTLPRNWDEIVVSGAIWRGHFFNEDYNLARQAKNFQVGLIHSAVPTEAKEEKDSRYAGLNVLTEWPVELEGE